MSASSEADEFLPKCSLLQREKKPEVIVERLNVPRLFRRIPPANPPSFGRIQALVEVGTFGRTRIGLSDTGIRGLGFFTREGAASKLWLLEWWTMRARAHAGNGGLSHDHRLPGTTFSLRTRPRWRRSERNFFEAIPRGIVVTIPTISILSFISPLQHKFVNKMWDRPSQIPTLSLADNLGTFINP
jgi:hypothetical protein